jgi:hypothetical protein
LRLNPKPDDSLKISYGVGMGVGVTVGVGVAAFACSTQFCSGKEIGFEPS